MRPIRTPKKSDGSVARGGTLINTLFAENRATVRERCKPLIDAFRLFDGNRKHETKDAFDACHYVTQALVKTHRVGSSPIAQIR